MVGFVFFSLLSLLNAEDPDSPCSLSCPMQEMFVCGSNGVSYLNECELNRAACENPDQIIEKASDGLCPMQAGYGGDFEMIEEDCRITACPYISDPLCGTDGRTYGNECAFKNAVCFAGLTGVRPPELEHEGECERKRTSSMFRRAGCMRVCTFEYTPLCASNGVTYSNRCVFDAATCEAENKGEDPLTVVHKGECAKSSCPSFCTLQFAPVCGTDGVTYSNSCFLGIASCENPSVALAYEGRCTPRSARKLESACSPICTREFKPQCGSDGVTYANPCLLETAICKDPSIVLSHEGLCAPSFPAPPPLPKLLRCRKRCPNEREYLCGSDGMSYLNKCHFEIGSCLDPELTVAAEGLCM